MSSTTLRRLALKVAFACAASACFTATFAADVLRVSAIPDEAPIILQRKFAALGK